MYTHYWQINVIQKLVMEFDRHTRAEENHDFLVAIFLQECEQQ